MDRTATAMGSRLLRRWLNRPLRDQAWCAPATRPSPSCWRRPGPPDLREVLTQIGDLERILARVALGSARPRDLAVLRDSLALCPDLQPAPGGHRKTSLLARLAAEIGEHPETVDLLRRAIIEQPPMLIRDGGVLAPGYRRGAGPAPGPVHRRRASSCWTWSPGSASAPGIPNLKVGYNRVHGYYIEVSRAQADQVPTDYVRRQTLKGVERYITPELKRFEDEVLSSRERALAREKALYEALLGTLAGVARTAAGERRGPGGPGRAGEPGRAGRGPRLDPPGAERGDASSRSSTGATRWWSR